MIVPTSGYARSPCRVRPATTRGAFTAGAAMPLKIKRDRTSDSMSESARSSRYSRTQPASWAPRRHGVSVTNEPTSSRVICRCRNRPYHGALGAERDERSSRRDSDSVGRRHRSRAMQEDSFDVEVVVARHDETQGDARPEVEASELYARETRRARVLGENEPHRGHPIIVRELSAADTPHIGVQPDETAATQHVARESRRLGLIDSERTTQQRVRDGSHTAADTTARPHRRPPAPPCGWGARHVACGQRPDEVAPTTPPDTRRATGLPWGR